MNKLFIAFLFIISSTIGISQNHLENKLLEVFSLEQTKLILEDKQQEKYYNNMVLNSYSIEEINPSKIKLQNFDVLSSLELKNIDGTITIVTPNELIESVNNGTFNILKLIIERDYHESKIYLLGNTNHLLKIKSFTTLSKLQKK